MSANGRCCCAVGSSRGMNLCGSLAMPAVRLDVKTNRGLIYFLNVWKWKQTLNGMMKKVKKMFSEMTQKHAKAAIGAANIYGGKNEIGHGDRGDCARSFVCHSE